MAFLYAPVLPAAADLLSGGGPVTDGYLKVWMGSDWQLKPVKVWTGSQWVQKPVKFWTGSQWTLA